LSAVFIKPITAFSPITRHSSLVQYRSAQADIRLRENFGFDFAESQVENTPAVILGEANYKQWVGTIQDNSFLNRQYNVLRRVRELDLVGLVADTGLLSKLEQNGLELATLEGLLPVAEQFGLLSLVGNNQQLFINLVAPILIEPAPILLPAIAGALDVGPPAFFLLSASLLGAEYYFVANDVAVPLIGLPAGALAGLLLVPLGLISGAAGFALSSLKK